MATHEPFSTIERTFIRPVLHFLLPRRIRDKVLHWQMKAYLFFKPIKYKYTQGDQGVGNRLCVFVSFQPNGILSTTWKYLKHLHEDLGYSIVFLSNCPLQNKDISGLQNICVEVIERDNVGYDFGAYKDGILRYIEKLGKKFDELETLLIANDSVIGPIHDMKPIHEKMQAEDCDFWGMNDAVDRCNNYYLTSYFICFKNSVLKSSVFKKYWNEVCYPSGRKFAIKYEKKTTQYFINYRFRPLCFVQKEDIIKYISHSSRFNTKLWFSSLFIESFKQEGRYEMTNSIFDILYLEHTNSSCPMLTLVHFGMPLMKRDLIKRDVVNMVLFKAILNMHEEQLTGIVTKEEILDEMGLNPRTQNSIFKWKKYII